MGKLNMALKLIFYCFSEAGQSECGAMQLRPFDRLRATTFHRD